MTDRQASFLTDLTQCLKDMNLEDKKAWVSFVATLLGCKGYQDEPETVSRLISYLKNMDAQGISEALDLWRAK